MTEPTSTPTSSAKCNERIHDGCDLRGCDCYCHLYEPRATFPRASTILLALIVWGLMLVCVYLIFLGVAVVMSS